MNSLFFLLALYWRDIFEVFGLFSLLTSIALGQPFDYLLDFSGQGRRMEDILVGFSLIIFV
jgi:hypothetical protein